MLWFVHVRNYAKKIIWINLGYGDPEGFGMGGFDS
jgi:hypothetical protein